MDQMHFGISSLKRGTMSHHIRYIMRSGTFSERDDFVGWGYDNLPRWARHEPEAFFLASDKHERANSPACISVVIGLPNCLNREQNMQLASTVMDSIATGRPYLFAFHENISSVSGVPYPHIHGMLSGRVDDGIERSPEQTFRRFNAAHPELGGNRKIGSGLKPSEIKNSTIEMRRIIAETINNALRYHGFHDRLIDHRTLREQGIYREPAPYLGPGQLRKLRRQGNNHYRGRRIQPDDNVSLESSGQWRV
ncbi:MobA/MobL family protein [Dyella monticola]|nr:MobA/MobL family protein [Dyella monticola]